MKARKGRINVRNETKQTRDCAAVGSCGERERRSEKVVMGLDTRASGPLRGRGEPWRLAVAVSGWRMGIEDPPVSAAVLAQEQQRGKLEHDQETGVKISSGRVLSL